MTDLIQSGIVLEKKRYSFFKSKKVVHFLIICLVALSIWFLPKPAALTSQAWHLLALFLATIVGIVLKPLPMGAMAILALAATVITNTLTFEQAFSGFSNDIVWLVVIAFFIAKGFIVTGLGNRVAYFFVSFFWEKHIRFKLWTYRYRLFISPHYP